MSSPDLIAAPARCGDVTLPVNPYVSNRYHFGMLLGVADLEAEQAYHRGKSWQHAAWLHGAGVVWGLGVELREESAELVVHPGLAVDAHGRELVVAESMCVDLGAWFLERRPEDLPIEDEGGDAVFDVQLELCHDSCLDRPVPSVSEPCEDASFDTAYSRTIERGLPRLVAPRPEPTEQYPRLRQLFGHARVTDPLVGQARDAIAASDPAGRASVRAEWFRRLAAADVTELVPQEGAPGWAPYAGQGCVLLADLHVRLTADGEGFAVVGGADGTTVQALVRPAHVRTRTVQELMCGVANAPAPEDGPDASPAAARGDPPDGGRLRAVADGATADAAAVSVRFTRPLGGATVHRDAFVVSVLRADGWHEVGVERAELLDEATVRLVLAGRPRSRPMRVVARGTGPAPLVAADGSVLAGVQGDPVVPSGADAALMITSTGSPQED